VRRSPYGQAFVGELRSDEYSVLTLAERALLIVNRSAGMGHSRVLVDRLHAMLVRSLGARAASEVEIVGDHPTARARASEFLAASDAPALILVGGGGGTLRAVIEGLCEGSEGDRLPGCERVLIGALRMGSGNVVARQFGVPRDPEAGLRSIIENLRASRTARCCVMRCEVGIGEGRTEVHYAATLGGLAQLGRVPGDLARWQRRFPASHKIAAKLLGLERLTNAEYALALLIRCASCALRGGTTAEVVEVRTRGRREVMRLLAGVAMNFPLKALPVDPGVCAEDEAFSLHLIPYNGRLSALLLVFAPRRLLRSALWIRVESSEQVEFRLVDRDSAEFFLDEDPMVFYGWLTVRVAGSLTFVPGSGYPFPAESEVFA
jgi:Diacylglycerol kinase catalytic domain